MSRRRPDPAMHALRQHIAAGDMESARGVLVEMLCKNPGNQRARAELERLDAGLPLHSEERSRERENAKGEQNQERLAAMLQEFTKDPQIFSQWDDLQLHRAKKELARRMKYAGRSLESADRRVATQYRQALSRELARRAKPMRRVLTLAASTAGGVALVIVIGMLMANHAERAAVRLNECLRNGDSAELATCLKACDTQMNRQFCKRLPMLITAAQARLKREQADIDDLTALFRKIEKGESSITELGPIRRMEIEHTLTTLPKAAQHLTDTWNRYCREEQEQLASQRLQYVQKLARPLPPMVTPSVNLQEDAQKLEELRADLQERCLIFADAHSSQQLDEELIRPAQDALKQVNALLQENRHLQDDLSKLATARDYDSYRKRLQAITPKLYTVLTPALETAKALPDHSTVLWEVRSHGRDIPQTQLQAARQTLVLGGPSITPEAPASAEETRIAEELLGAPALRTPLHAVTNETGEVNYTEQEPTVKDGKVHFKRTLLDPAKPTGSGDKVEWPNPHWVKMHRIDPSLLAQQLNTDDRATFLGSLHYGRALEGVLRSRAPECPALARAFVYDCLVRMMHAREERMLTGLPYSPSLQEDIRDFEAVKARCGVELTGDCWLRQSAAHTRAEREFADWFAAHNTASYSAEMAENFASFMAVRPRFCGFVTPNGHTRLNRKPKPGEQIWYMTADGISTTRNGEDLEDAVPFSPLFVAEKAAAEQKQQK